MTRVVVAALALALGVAIVADDGAPEREPARVVATVDVCADPVATARTEAVIWRLSYDACMEGWRGCVNERSSRLYWPIVLRRR